MANFDVSEVLSSKLEIKVNAPASGNNKTKDETNLQPKEGQCSFFVLRKKRFCRFPSHSDQKYCAEHAIIGGATLKRKRVQCPLNPKHTCYEDNLEKHKKKCMKLTKNNNVYYVEGINAGEIDDIHLLDDKSLVKTVKNASKQELLSLIERVNLLHDEHVSEIPLEELCHHSLEQELSAPNYGFKVLRQRKQQASLIGHLEKMGFLKDGVCYAELGAGRGQLAHWVQLALETCDNSAFILVDKGTCRYKFDSFHRGENQGPTFERLQVDLADIHLGKVPSICEKKRPVLGMGKHLCGAATDLALRCLTRTLRVHTSDDDTDQRVPLLGLAIALCCHHRCTWQSYVGKAFIQNQCKLSPADFQLLCSMTSWATCSWEGWKKHVPLDNTTKKTSTTNSIMSSPEENEEVTVKTREITNNPDTAAEKSREITNNPNNIEETSGEINVVKLPDDFDDEDEHKAVPTNERNELGFTSEERELIGRKCKQLIDIGRVLYLQENSMTSLLKAYIEESYTPENIVLLATPTNKPR